jgi:hypothetical protein
MRGRAPAGRHSPTSVPRTHSGGPSDGITQTAPSRAIIKATGSSARSSMAAMRAIRAPSYRPTPPSAAIHKRPSPSWSMSRTQLPGNPSRTRQTSRVYSLSDFSGSRASAGGAWSANASARPVTTTTRTGRLILAAAAAGVGERGAARTSPISPPGCHPTGVIVSDPVGSCAEAAMIIIRPAWWPSRDCLSISSNAPCHGAGDTRAAPGGVGAGGQRRRRVWAPGPHPRVVVPIAVLRAGHRGVDP